MGNAQREELGWMNGCILLPQVEPSRPWQIRAFAAKKRCLEWCDFDMVRVPSCGLQDVFNVVNLKDWNPSTKGLSQEIPWTQWTGRFLVEVLLGQCESCFESDVFLVSLHLAPGFRTTQHDGNLSFFDAKIVFHKDAGCLVFFLHHFVAIRFGWINFGLSNHLDPCQEYTSRPGTNRTHEGCTGAYSAYEQSTYSSLSFIERGTCVRKAFTFEVMS